MALSPVGCTFRLLGTRGVLVCCLSCVSYPVIWYSFSWPAAAFTLLELCLLSSIWAFLSCIQIISLRKFSCLLLISKRPILEIKLFTWSFTARHSVLGVIAPSHVLQ